MRRRDLFEAMAAGALLPVQGRGRRRRAAAPSATEWRFDLDGRNRWSLLRLGESAVRSAEILVEMAGREPLPLAALSDLRRYRSSYHHWTVVGHAGDVEVTAHLEGGEEPQITVQLRGLDVPRDVAQVHFTGGLSVAHDTAWINGYQSWSACTTVPLGARTAATGHWQLALIGGRGPNLALSFGPDDGAAGEFRLTGRALDAAAQFVQRPVSVDLSPASASLTILPSADPLETLGALAGRLAGGVRPVAPAGWCSWYELYARVTEDDVLANLAAARASFDPRAFRYLQLDDGYQRAAGDWETNGKFPHGHRWLTDRIHEAGYQAGLWLAPFAVTAPSGIPTARPDWLVLGPDGQPAPMDDQPHWGGRAWALDASLREVQDWLRELARHAVTEWGYDYLKLDFLHYGARGARAKGGAGPHEALRAGLRALHEGAGRAYLLGCGAPLQQSVGLFDGMRIGPDVDATWDGLAPGAVAAEMRAHYQARAWHNDPDALVVRPPLTLDEARAWASVVALSGGVTMASDHLPRLPAERIELLQRTMPVARVRARALDLLKHEAVVAPALVLESQVLATLPRRWRFHVGDDAAWSAPDLDEGTWSDIDVGVNWEQAGHEGLDGFGWYRGHFRAPRRPAGSGAGLALVLGKIDDADEAFLNGTHVGQSGAFPPNYRSSWESWRRYAVPPQLVRWGKDNVVAIRVYDGGGAGGLWSLTRDRPPSQLLAQTAPDRWMAALVNWDETAHRDVLDLAAHGAAGSFAAYDVWQESRLPDMRDRLALTVPPHSAVVVALARSRATPFVLGSTRHVVQHQVDVAEEHWDARARKLSGRSTMLDGRPYAITLAVPAGLAARSCRGGAGCSIARSDKGWARLEFAGTREDLEWEVTFGTSRR